MIAFYIRYEKCKIFCISFREYIHRPHFICSIIENWKHKWTNDSLHVNIVWWILCANVLYQMMNDNLYGFCCAWKDKMLWNQWIRHLTHFTYHRKKQCFVWQIFMDDICKKYISINCIKCSYDAKQICHTPMAITWIYLLLLRLLRLSLVFFFLVSTTPIICV